MANCMRGLLPLLLALYAFSASAQLPVNVDCGTSVDVVGFKGMSWVGDDQYVRSGRPGTVQNDVKPISPLTTLRYFPSGKKNCYSFSGVGRGNKILVRAWFLYGNYDGLSLRPTFNLLFNGNLWGTVNVTGTSIDDNQRFEMIYITKADDVSICLARTNPNDVPFINSLEIKQLDQGMYQDMDTNRPLYVKGRYAYASATDIRYPDDDYDRIWSGFTKYASFGLSPLNGDGSNPTINVTDKPPAAVLRQAITTSSTLASNLTIPTLIDSPLPVPHYVTFYFEEVSPVNTTRSFDIFLDNQKFYSKTVDVSNENLQEIYHPKIDLSTSSTFTLVRTHGSSLPPLINAAEFFMLGEQWLDLGTETSDVKALSELQKNYVQLQQWSGDPCLPVGYAWEWLNCSSDSTPRVTALYLSGHGLTGPLVDFSNLTALQTIDLQNNSLSGSIPEFLGNLPNLKQLNLADNQFNGSLPASLTRNSIINLNISGNKVSNSSDYSNRSGKKISAGLVAGATAGLLLFILLLVMIAILIFKKRSGNAVQLNRSEDIGKPAVVLLEPEIKHGFPYAEIVEITNNFEKVIGEGGSGNVYYGQLKNGNEVAVKVLKNSLSQGTKEFLAEVKLLVTVHHKCLVSFVGYCEEGGRLILLYENMSGGNLRQLLSGKISTSAFLTWSSRLQVALSVATGLDYLHSGCNPPIIHRDVKTSNILLNAKMEAKVADFGLSKAGQKDDVTQLSTVVAGTPGYIDPEYYSTNLVTKKSDVYSFGVVLFELMTGYPPVFDVSGERFHIVQWVAPRLTRGDIHGVADPKLRGQYNVNSMWKVADIAMSCTSQPSHSRPHMSDVVNQLKEAIETESYYQQTDAPSTEVQHSSSSPYEFSSSFLSTSYLPPAR